MNYATKELTASLQELTSKRENQSGENANSLPSSLVEDVSAVSAEVESFLERSREYSAKTRNVHVGTY